MTKATKSSTVSRRRVLAGTGAAAAAVAFPGILTPRKAGAATKLTVRDPGGPYVKAYAAAYYEPFNKKFAGKIEVTGVIGKHEPTSQIKAMVDTGTYTWDCALLSEAAHNLLRDANYLEKLANRDHPDVQEIPDEFKTEYLQGVDVYGTVLAYRNDVYPSKARAPDQGWKDLWDVEGIPGVRAIRKHPFDTIEEALIADGVPAGEEYDWIRNNGYDRAFASLDKIKPHIDIWWTGGAQTSQLLSTGEVDICPTWNGRAQAAIDGGAPVTISWNEGIFNFEGWCILRGTPNMEAAQEFVTFCANAQTQALQAPHISYGPVNPNAYEYIDAERAKVLSTNPEFLPLMHKADNVFWGKEKDKATELFDAWLVG